MASEIRFAASDAAFYYSGTGRVSSLEVLGPARSFRSLARSSSISRILIDLSSATTLEITTSQVRDLAAISLEAAKFTAGARLAIAAPQAHIFGLARMWAVFMEGSSWEIQIFPDRESAVAWLDIPSLPENSTALDLSM